MKKEQNLLLMIKKWLEDGDGLQLKVGGSETWIPRYQSEETLKTKTEKQLYGESPHALVVIGQVSNVPDLDVPMFVFSSEGKKPNLPNEEAAAEAYIYDVSAKNPLEAVANAQQYFKMEFGDPAKGDRPKFLVIAEYPLLAAVALGTLSWIDFYFRPADIKMETEAEKDELISAYLGTYVLSRGHGGLRLSVEKIMNRPALKKTIPLIKEYCGFLSPELIKAAGIQNYFLEQEIIKRKEEIN